jgi:hypothetical protein
MPLYNIFKENMSSIIQGNFGQTLGGKFSKRQRENKSILSIAVFMFA